MHGKEGSPSKCPFAAILQSATDNPLLEKEDYRFSDSAGEDTDTESDEENFLEEEGEVPKPEFFAAGEHRGSAEAEARRARMLKAMQQNLSMSGTASENETLAFGEASEGASGINPSDASSKCPFAAMFGMGDATPAKRKPLPSITEKFLREHGEEIEKEMRENPEGSSACPFAQMFGVTAKAETEAEARRRKLIEDADKPGRGQFVWPRKNSQPGPESDARRTASASAAPLEGRGGGDRAGHQEAPSTKEGLSEAIRKAGEIKSAQMKADPRRREWEEAPVWMRCTCGEEGELGDARRQGYEGKASASAAWRAEGNSLFKKGKYETAISSYAKSMAVFYWFKLKDGRRTDEVRLRDETEGLAEPQREEARDAVVKAFLNIAACLLKLGRWGECQYACNKALHFDEKNAKALYRRAQAYKAENSAYKLELAVRDLRRAVKAEPTNPELRRAYQRYSAELEEQNRRDGRTFGKMFGRGCLYSDAEAEAFRKPDEPSGLPPINKEAVALASKMGIDLQDPMVCSELARLHKESLCSASSSGHKGHNQQRRSRHWWIEMTLRYKWVAYLMLGIHVTWRVWAVFYQIRMQLRNRESTPSLATEEMLSGNAAEPLCAVVDGTLTGILDPRQCL
uniref:Peptidyl-prolyl cis-trans isomerase fkbp65-like n=1 Tax=Tetraselmis sp. GSL018 TaxID=582737 RepID=A0A061RY74_9CHLO